MCSGVLYSPSKVEQEQKTHDLSICEEGPSISFFFFSQWFGILLGDKRSQKILYMVIRGGIMSKYKHREEKHLFFNKNIEKGTYEQIRNV